MTNNSTKSVALQSAAETAAHLLHALHLATTIGDVGGKAFNQLVEVGFFNVRPDDEHDFVGTIHLFTSFCEVLLRTVLTCLLPTRFGLYCVWTDC